MGAAVDIDGPPSNGRIIVKLPEVPDRDRLRKALTEPAHLDLYAVLSPPNPLPVEMYDTKEDALETVKSNLEKNQRALPYDQGITRASGGSNQEMKRKWVLVETPAIVDGKDLSQATVFEMPNKTEEYGVRFSLKPEGAKKLAAWTGTHINSYLAVALNDEVKSVAFIKGQLTDQGELTGRFNKQNAEDLAGALVTGALPAQLKIVDVRDY
jgi:preprotein translocase subunit SecD